MSAQISTIRQVFWAVAITAPQLINSNCVILTPIPSQQQSETFLPVALLKQSVQITFFFLFCKVSYCISPVKVVAKKKKTNNKML